MMKNRILIISTCLVLFSCNSIKISSSKDKSQVCKELIKGFEQNKPFKNSYDVTRTIQVREVFDTINNLKSIEFLEWKDPVVVLPQKDFKTKVYKLVVKDAFTLSKVLTGLEEEDISNVSVTKTEYSKEDELLLELKTKAILMAQSNAKALVTPLNQKLLKAIRISDQSRFQYYSAMDSSLKMEAMNSMGNDKPSPIQNIEFQNIKFTTTVNVTFAIE